MGELDDSFATLLGRQPTDKEKQALYRVRDALKLKATDAVWLLLMALQHYETLYEQLPRSDRRSRPGRDQDRSGDGARRGAVRRRADQEGARGSGPGSRRSVGQARCRSAALEMGEHRRDDRHVVDRHHGVVAVRAGRARRHRHGMDVGDEAVRERRGGGIVGEHARGSARLQARASRKPP